MNINQLDKNQVQEILEKYEVKSVLTQNTKMKKSSRGDTLIYNWGIPAFKSKTGFKTCPKAGKCAIGCYATQGAYKWNNVAKAFENRLQLSTDKNFDAVMLHHIGKVYKKASKQGKNLLIRIHDSGDFYDLNYILTWLRIMNSVKYIPEIEFYAYTKMVSNFKELFKNYPHLKPVNFTLIYSLGGLEDDLIDVETDRHSKVFESEAELIEAGYVNASDDDKKALGKNHKIGLIYHGAKSYNKTAWNRVKK